MAALGIRVCPTAFERDPRAVLLFFLSKQHPFLFRSGALRLAVSMGFQAI